MPSIWPAGSRCRAAAAPRAGCSICSPRRSAPELVIYADPARGAFRYASFVEGVCDACLFLSRGAAGLPPREAVAALLGSEIDPDDAHEPARPERPGARAPADAGPTICACFGVGLRTLHDTIAQPPTDQRRRNRRGAAGRDELRLVPAGTERDLAPGRVGGDPVGVTRQLAARPMNERARRRKLARAGAIALLETREAERLGQMLREQGAEIVSVPAVAIVDAADPAPVLAWIERFVADPADYLVLLTGEGLTPPARLATRAGSAPVLSFRWAVRRQSSAARSRRGPCASSVLPRSCAPSRRPPKASSRCSPASICAAGASACSYTRTRRAASPIFSKPSAPCPIRSPPTTMPPPHPTRRWPG